MLETISMNILLQIPAAFAAVISIILMVPIVLTLGLALVSIPIIIVQVIRYTILSPKA